MQGWIDKNYKRFFWMVLEGRSNGIMSKKDGDFRDMFLDGFWCSYG